MTSILGDVKDLAHLVAVFEEHRPEIVIHMAAQSLVRRSYTDPTETYHTNVMGTVNILEACRQCQSVKAVVVVTSDKCYENIECARPYCETDRLGGHDPYSSSKACAELVAIAYNRSFFTSANGLEHKPFVATARAGNVIGGGDWAQDRLIPDCIRSLSDSRPIQLRFPAAVRPWQHVLEPLYGYMTLVERLMGEHGETYCEAWNFGPASDSNATVLEVVNKVGNLWGDASVEYLTDDSTPHESGMLRLDATKAATHLGWRPLWSLDRAIEETTSWYKAWRRGEDMRAYTLAQISAFEADVEVACKV